MSFLKKCGVALNRYEICGGVSSRILRRILGLLLASCLWNAGTKLASPEPLKPNPAAGVPSSTRPDSAHSKVGNLRVGNRTPYPVRVVLLLRQGGNAAKSEPAHWDFAPGEGGSEGLLLSLTDRPLQMEPGDVVVAFTLDGSRRYWGPNVVGESLAPFWDAKHRVWSMVLQP